MLTTIRNLEKPTVDDDRFRDACVLVVKVTTSCNLSCSYCYENAYRNGQQMSLTTWQEIIAKTLRSSTRRLMAIIIHGGEPTLVPAAWMDNACDYAFRVAADAEKPKKIAVTVQSNLVTVSRAWVAVARKHGIHISVSLDGPSEIPSHMRPNTGSALMNYFRLRDSDISLSVLTTINQSNWDQFDRIAPWVHKELSQDAFKANPVFPVGRAAAMSTLKPKQIVTAQTAILQYMITCSGTFLEHNLAEEILRFFATEDERRAFPRALHLDRPCGAGREVLSFSPTGHIFPCGRLPDADKRYDMGTIQNINYDLFASAIVAFHREPAPYMENCRSCVASRICDGGCQAFVLNTHPRSNPGCLPTILRHAFYVKNRERLIPVLSAIRRHPGYRFAGRLPFRAAYVQ
nr:radical SAM protein [Accumulibacter sp.]